MLCDRVAILVKGKVVRHGPLGSLTAPEAQYRVTVASEDSQAVEAALTAVDDAPESMQAPPGQSIWRLTVVDRAQLNLALDQIREAGLEIEEVRRVRATLEEVFVQTISDASEQGIVDAATPGGASGDMAANSSDNAETMQ